MKVLFLDESGDHNLAVIDPQYPLFVLGGVVVERGYARGELTERLGAFKERLLGRRDLALHTADIVRNRNGFERMKEPAFRQRFLAELRTGGLPDCAGEAAPGARRALRGVWAGGPAQTNRAGPRYAVTSPLRPT
ncbi:MAG: DUF3800 domain-containing protein [Gemmatimonadetes bacterium]|nr:DUF3800 domain-containing protein [Gemmatimonadota bacterium]